MEGIRSILVQGLVLIAGTDIDQVPSVGPHAISYSVDLCTGWGVQPCESLVVFHILLYPSHQLAFLYFHVMLGILIHGIFDFS